MKDLIRDKYNSIKGLKKQGELDKGTLVYLNSSSRLKKVYLYLQLRSKKMTVLKQVYIQKTAAALMLLIFALSITPTIVFHNWLADHTDTVKKITHNQTEQIGKITFNCYCDNIVAESPFTETAKASIFPPRQSYNLFKAERHILFFSSPSPLHSLRGPPVV